jgi:predicted acyl esterase
LTTGFYDIYTGGIFDMWNGMSNKTRQMSALVVSPYDHKDNFNEQNAIKFNNGRLREQFGEDYEIEWFNHIRDNSVKNPFEKGKVTYYRLFENRWASDSFNYTKDAIKTVLGNEDCSYVYNPYDAPGFKGGLSTNFGGSEFQDKPGWRHDVITVYTKRFQSDVFVKGKMSAKLCVISDCEDTCFYMRISIEKEQGDFGLRDDITSLCFGGKSYTPGEEAVLDFEFDEHAFFIKKGERLRIDIASADNNHYVRHTNNKGLYSEMTTAKIAKNTVRLHKSYLSIPTGE